VSQGSAVRFGRNMAEARMTDTCEITRETGSTVDPATGLNTPTTVTVYSGKCRLKFTTARVFKVEAAGQVLGEEKPELSLPIGAAGAGDVRAKDVVTITAVDPVTGDPALVGTRLVVDGPHSQTAATAHRFPVLVVS